MSTQYGHTIHLKQAQGSDTHTQEMILQRIACLMLTVTLAPNMKSYG